MSMVIAVAYAVERRRRYAGGGKKGPSDYRQHTYNTVSDVEGPWLPESSILVLESSEAQVDWQQWG